ncbi:crotonyl-CoA carboxylase/reductase [Caenispirillum bisanense]|uniref:crotonyl-CoA carboxylase/reductase n=1 Tax=Caenispirillum bisanense TaxID=414052 RepID=UPI0031DD9893
MSKELYDIGEMPPLGVVPPKMHAWLIRAERFGEPKDAFKLEVVDTPEIGDYDVLVYVMAAGINYNNVWAGLGVPINVIAARNKAGEPEDFHIGGSDASGIVYKVGPKVTNVKVGDEVVVHCGTYDPECPSVQAGVDQMYSPTYRIWGYETNYGSFAQFTRVKGTQCVPKPKHLTWEGAAAYMLVGATAYRMLLGWNEHALRAGDVALIWGGAGGLGSMAIQIARAKGATPIAVVSGEDKFDYCMQLGAKGCINRNKFDHWGMLPHWKDTAGYNKWLKGVRAFGQEIWNVLGEKKQPRIVFEHPGETTIPSSLFVCDTGGMVVVCAGTTGYNATVDLRYLWMRQKRVQGSHFANDAQCYAFNQMVIDGLIDPCLSRGFTWNEIPHVHQLMYENKHPHGNMGVLVGAKEFGLGASASEPVPLPHPHLPETGAHDLPRTLPVSIPLDDVDSGAVAASAAANDDAVVRDIMVRDMSIVAPTDTVATAAHMMLSRNTTAVVVADQGNPVGIVSHTDVVLAGQGRPVETVRNLPVREVMTPNPYTIDAGVTLTDAVSVMTGKRIHHLVVTEGGKAIGIIATGDVMRRMVAEEARSAAE